MTWRRTIAATALLLAGCSAAGTAPTPTNQPPPTEPRGDGSPPFTLDGRTFLSIAIDGRVLVPRSRVRLAFAGGHLGASAGCNSMGAPYVVDGGTLEIGMVSMTEMGCDPLLMAQDAWLARFLDRASISLADDVLTLAKDRVTMELLDREVADPDRPLIGTRWMVDGLVAGDTVSSVPEGVVASILIAEDRVIVSAGCNSGAASVEITETTLAFRPLVLTKRACQPKTMAIELAVTAALTGTVAYAIEADVLALDAGGTGLLLRAAP